MVLNDRDKKLLQFITDYKSLSIKQASNIIFNGTYVSARRRLAQLEERGLLKSAINKVNGEKIYYKDKLLKMHELLLLDFISKVYELGGEIFTFKTTPHYLGGDIVADAYVEVLYNDKVYFILLEIDYTHETSLIKMKEYERLYKSGELQKNCMGEFPRILIARVSESIRYNSYNFPVIYTNLEFENVERLLFY